MRHIGAIGALAGATLLASSAFAADIYVEPAPVYEPVAVSPHFDWAGPYLGINGGWAWSEVDWTYDDGNPADHDGDGGLAGGTLGWNFQTGQWVFGVEGDFDWADVNGSTACPNPSFSCESEMDWFATVRGRVGFAANNWLFYGTGGLAVADLTMQTVLPGGSVPPSGTPTNGSSETAVGWTAGAGVEVGFARRWTVKAEWLYYDLGSDNYTVDNGLVVHAKETGNIARIGLNYIFN
jgi:outer membrane immunogenic protein